MKTVPAAREVVLGGRRLRPARLPLLGSGGEAEVYALDDGRALKVFKPPDHMDYATDPAQAEAARARLAILQEKLPAFPGGLPARVVAPQELAHTPQGGIAGYAMARVDGEPLYRLGTPTGTPGLAAIPPLFLDLHATLSALHSRGVVVGDFHDLNVLVEGIAARLVDADSAQFGPFPCPTFTERFLDPRLADESAARPWPRAPHDPDSDWYAFAAMLFRTLLLVDPWGGVHRPPPGEGRVLPSARARRRIWALRTDVVYPRSARSPDVLPDDLRSRFEDVFVRDLREPFPLDLVAGLAVRRCGCGTEHLRSTCPTCLPTAPAAIRDLTRTRGEVTLRRVVAAEGRFLAAAADDVVRWAEARAGRIVREDGRDVGPDQPGLRVLLAGADTILVSSGIAVLVPAAGPPERVDADPGPLGPAVASAGASVLWIAQGTLYRRAPWGPERLGSVLPGRTALFAGRGLSLGIAAAAGYAFVADPARRVIDDGLRLSWPPGELIEATCAFAAPRAWLLAARREGARVVHRAALVRADGSVQAHAEAEPGDGSWLGDLHGRAAAGDWLFAPTDQGLVRVRAEGGAARMDRIFPGTEGLVDGRSRLAYGPAGLFASTDREIVRLEHAG